MKTFLKHILLFLVSINFSSRASMNSSESLEWIQQNDKALVFVTPIFLLHRNPYSNGETVLHAACSQGCLDMVTNIFYRKDMNPCSLLLLQDASGYLLLDKAAENDHVNVIDFLLDMNETHNPHPVSLIFHKNILNGGTPLHHAIKNGAVKAVNRLITAAKQYRCLTEYLFNEQLGHITTLHLSVLCGYREITEILLKHAGENADRLAATYNNPCFQDQITPIHDAIRKEDVNTIKVFIKILGTRALNIQNKKGITALEYAKTLDSKAINSVLTMYSIK